MSSSAFALAQCTCVVAVCAPKRFGFVVLYYVVVAACLVLFLFLCCCAFLPHLNSAV